mmetsp:Transcript_13412/g.24839  ORF Transcript_13412/g.24839 Transcript_13412/m.24839 type:complete len:433 (+) Transcript_13412:178-1476(+)
MASGSKFPRFQTWITLSVLLTVSLGESAIQSESTETKLNPQYAEEHESPVVLPVVSVDDAFGGSELPDDVTRALAQVGAFFIRMKGFDLESAQNALASSHELFSSPDEIKTAREFKMTRGKFRGFIPLLGESGDASLAEVKEGFSLGKPGEGGSSVLEDPNLWPPSLSRQAQATLEKTFSTFARMATKTINTVLEKTPGLEGISSLCENGDAISLFRMFRYFSISSEEFRKIPLCKAEPKRCTGSSPHTDWGLLTFIVTEDLNALQFFVNGTWRGAQPSHPGTDDSCLVLVNVGDYLALASKGALVSPIHRVLLSDEERLSLVFFAYPGKHAKLPDISGAQRYLSLVEDQSVARNKLSHLDISQDFIDLILSKWTQVHRNSPHEELVQSFPWFVATAVLGTVVSAVAVHKLLFSFKSETEPANPNSANLKRN